MSIDLFAGHLLGDILLQNRWLARVKQRGIQGILLHCLIVTLSVCAFMGWWDYRGLLIFFSHFGIDYFGLGKSIWPKLLNQGNPNDNEPAPMWLGLLDDQSLHIISLALINKL